MIVDHTPRDSVVARFAQVTKTFGATQALRGIDLEIRAGEIHALVGENGAGKSTALGCLAGRVKPTRGRIEVFGDELTYGDPRASRRAGVVAIYQELTVIPHLNAEANVFLGQPLSRAGLLSKSAMRKRYEAICGEVGVAVHPPSVTAAQMSVAGQQLLEIMRALVSRAEIILFDEPTASLGESEREALFRLMRQLRSQGMTIVFVSHNLDEVLEISDSITVFRDGSVVASEPASAWSKVRLVRSMLGDSNSRVAAEMLQEGASTVRRTRARGSQLVVAEGVTVPGAVLDLEIEIHEGEIVGVAGLVGSGRSTLLRALAGLEPKARGRLWVKGKEVAWPHSVRSARALGIALLPEDRKSQGLVPGLTAQENVVMSDFGAAARWGFVSPRRMQAMASRVAPDFGFSVSRLGARAGDLSGGNQQKLLLARWKHWRPAVLLADEPTRGIDIGAKDEISRAIESMAAEGLGVAIVSSELAEVAAISGRVVVLSEGRLAGWLDSAEGEITVSAILHTAFDLEVSR